MRDSPRRKARLTPTRQGYALVDGRPYHAGVGILKFHGKCFWRPGEEFPYPDPCPYEWTLAGDIFASPVVTNSTSKTVTFPEAGQQWASWWDDSEVYNGYGADKRLRGPPPPSQAWL